MPKLTCIRGAWLALGIGIVLGATPGAWSQGSSRDSRERKNAVVPPAAAHGGKTWRPGWHREHELVVLPPAVVGTSLSYQIDTQASYLSNYGDMVQSMASARKINAEAVHLEIQNEIDAVDGYFKRRELNRTNRKYELDAQEREQRHQERMKRNVEQYRQSHGDVTGMLNWLLQELASPTLAHRYLPGAGPLVKSELDQKLSPDDLKLVRLTDGAGKTKTLVFSADDGMVLKTHWPLALQAADFQKDCRQFEDARDDFLTEVRAQGRIGPESAKRLQESVIALMVALEGAYPEAVRRDPNQFVRYAASKRFLQGLWGSVERAVAVKDLSVFFGGLRFRGESVVALMQHMYASGLEFAPPEPGGESIYGKLFAAMKNLYINLAPHKEETGPVRSAPVGL